MPRFAIAYRVRGSLEPATYYRVGGYGPKLRVGNSTEATTWNTEKEARQAVQEFGLSGDPEVFVVDISDEGH